MPGLQVEEITSPTKSAITKFKMQPPKRYYKVYIGDLLCLESFDAIYEKCLTIATFTQNTTNERRLSVGRF